MVPRTGLAPGYTGRCLARVPPVGRRQATAAIAGRLRKLLAAPPHGRRELYEDARAARVTAALNGDGSLLLPLGGCGVHVPSVLALASQPGPREVRGSRTKLWHEGLPAHRRTPRGTRESK